MASGDTNVGLTPHTLDDALFTRIHYAPWMKDSRRTTSWYVWAVALLMVGIISDSFHVLSPLSNTLGTLIAEYEYQRGLGLDGGDFTFATEDFGKAAEWYRRAADHGYAPAQEKLGDLYFRGHGVKEDDTEALKWYLEAANQGNGEAQEKIGLMYMRGIGVPRNYMESFFWLSLARKSGVDIRKRLVDDPPGDSEYDPDKKLTPDQITDVNSRVLKWKPNTSSGRN